MSLFCQTDVSAFRTDRLALAAQSHPEIAGLTDTAILNKLIVAERDIARQLKVFLEPTTIFPYEPSAEEIEALENKPWAEEPGYDYDPEFFRGDSWGFLVLNHRPVVSVEMMRFAYPSPQNGFYEIPSGWIRLDKKAGQVRLVPVNQAMTAPLSAFMMQAMGGGRGIPYMLQVKYVAGLKDAKKEWPDLVDLIMKSAVLSAVKDAFKPQSGSISADGMSQSLTIESSKYEDLIQEKLFGPKGSNGGLWTAIHGLPGTVAGSSV